MTIPRFARRRNVDGPPDGNEDGGPEGPPSIVTHFACCYFSMTSFFAVAKPGAAMR